MHNKYAGWIFSDASIAEPNRRFPPGAMRGRMADRSSPVGSLRGPIPRATMSAMSVSSFLEGATRQAGRLPGIQPGERFAPLVERMTRKLWMRDRGLAELRWAAVTLGTIALLGLVAGLLHAAGDFDQVRIVATPAAVLVAAAAWGPYASRLGRSRAVRLSLGPAVLLVAVLGSGLANVATLQLPPAAPLIVLAMAYSAMTPGYPIAAVLILCSSVSILLAHTFGPLAPDATVQATDRFVVSVVVTLLASAGMAIVVRIATDAEARANRLAAGSRERLDVLERLNRIVARFDGSQPVRAVVQEVVEDVARDFDIALISMYLPDRDGRLSMVGVAGYPSPFHVIEIGVGVIGRAAATQTTQFVPDVLADPDYRAARADVRSEVAVPVVHSAELLSIVNFEGTAEHPIGPAQVALAEMLAHSLAGALRSARLDDERRERLHAIERVMAVSRALVADLDRPRIVASIVDVAAELLSADVVVLISSSADRRFRIEAGRGFPAEAIGFEISPREGLTGRCITERVRIEGVLDSSSWLPAYRAQRPGGESPHTTMVLPILIGEEVAAVLVVSQVGAERNFTELERAIADLLTAQVAIALRNADLHARVAESALRDPLTGLLNRRYFDEAVETAHASARRSGDPLSLIVLDLDRFSAVNNEHGHSVGDAVLRRVARSIKGAVREGDVVVRYGGEEFVVVTPGTDDDGAVEIAERIRHAVAHAGSEPIDGRMIPLTISGGVACLVDEPDGRGLFRAADSALLAAKRAGRNRVTRI
jgi:diguanylate cyclase (GGDEF)-like protein